MNSGGEETASGGDKGWGGAEGGFGRDEFVTKKRGKREREVEGVIGRGTVMTLIMLSQIHSKAVL